MSEKKIAIIDIGMITAVGLNAAQTTASVRAGISGYSETSIYDKRFNPFTMAILPEDVFPPLTKEINEQTGLTARQIRMLRLATPALQEAVKNATAIEEIPLFLGVPEAFPDRPLPVEESFLQNLSDQSEIMFNITASKIYAIGRAAGLFALKYAMDSILSGENTFALVGGIDTYVDLYLLGTLDKESRILATGIMDGFVPGEGAGFMLLTGAVNAKENNLAPFSFLSSVCTGFEEGHLYSENPYQGNGLATTFTDLFANNKSDNPIETVYSSMNGENHWAKEWGVAFMRNQKYFNTEHGMFHPAEFIGDTGAASGILFTGMAAIGIKREHIKNPCLITCSSDFGERAATIVLNQ